MPDLIHDLQCSFAGGEIAPEFWGRTDLQQYKTAAKTLRNMIPHPSGATYNRPGTYYVANARYSDKTCRLVKFAPSADSAYVLEFGDQYVRFYKDGGQIQSAGLAYTVGTPYLYTELADLRFTRSADTLYIVHPDHQPQLLQRISDTNWVLSAYAFKNGPFMLGNADTAKTMSWGGDGGGNYIASNFDFFQPGHAGAKMQITQFADADVLSATRNSTGTFTWIPPLPSGVLGTMDFVSHLVCGGGWRFRTHGTWTGIIAIQKSEDSGHTWTNVQFFKSQGDVNFDTFGTIDISLNQGNPVWIRADMVDYTSGTATVDLSIDPYEVLTTINLNTYSTPRKMYIDVTDLPFATTSLWAEGSWSDYRGWPSVVGFFQDRLGFAATAFEPQTCWFTKTSNYVDFGRSLPLVASDGITVNLLSRQVNPIINMETSFNACIFFTGFSYWTVSSTDGGPLTPTTVFQKLQENRGINSVDPVIVGNRLLFIDSRGATVRDIEYQYLTDRYQSENVSLKSEHLFRTYTIVDMAYQQIPNSIIWLVRSDGALLSCTYLREQEFLAWARHDTNGTFESVCSIPGDGVDEVWFVVNRGTNGRFIERMLLRSTDSSTDPADQYFVDAGIYYNGDAASTLSGFGYLGASTVAINANGFVQPQQAVSGGNVTVPVGTTKAAIGLPFTSDLETLNPDFPLQDGTSQGRKYQINRAVFRFLYTVGGKVGPDFDTLDDTNMRASLYPAISSVTPTPLFTGFDSYTIPGGDDSHGRICYRQTDPMPVTVLAIMPLVSPGQMP